MKASRLIRSLFTGLLLLLLSGCDEEQYRLKFSHYIHVTDNGMDCEDCHGELGNPELATLSHESCSDCHDETDAEEINADTCGYCHEKKLLPRLAEWQPEPDAPRRDVFVHTEAMAGKCSECHGAILSEDLEVVPRLQRADILEIRDKGHRSEQDCLMCHVDMDRYQAPPNHDLVWERRHGQLGMQEDAVCSVCHSEDSCRECHSVMQPVSHNNMWRLRTHGIVSAWDRQRCMVCHEEDSCISCHSQVKPRSHGPLWGERHGTWDPGRCMVCHEPDYCNSCHSQNAPRSHRANWDDRHCMGCHITNGDNCVVCHEQGNNVQLHMDYWPSFHDSLGLVSSDQCEGCHF